MFQNERTRQAQKKSLNEMEISNLPDKELKGTAMKMLMELGRGVAEQSENFQEEGGSQVRPQSKSQ